MGGGFRNVIGALHSHRHMCRASHEQKALAKWGAANPKIEPMPHKYATYKPHYYQHAHAKILIFVCHLAFAPVIIG